MKALSRKTMAIVVGIIIAGFAGMVLNNFLQNRRVYDEERSAITELNNDKIYYEIEGIFQLLIERSLMLSDDKTIHTLVFEENEITENGSEAEIAAIRNEIQETLEHFRVTFNCDTVFLVSDFNKHYYSDKGLTSAYVKGDRNSDWYFALVDQQENFVLNEDFDISRGGVVTLFVNCKIFDDNGNIIGAAGFGVRLDSVQEVLTRNGLYENISAYLLDADGHENMSSVDETGSGEDFFAYKGYTALKETILTSDEPTFNIVNYDGSRNYVASRKLEGTPWVLVTAMVTDLFDKELQFIVFTAIIICTLLIIVVVYAIRLAMNNYERQISLYEDQLVQQSRVFRNATSKLYDNIFHINVSKNTGVDEQTKEYFNMTGENPMSFSDAFIEVAQKHIMVEDQEKYINSFSIENIIHNFLQGNNNLELRVRYRDNEQSGYYWMLIVVYIYKTNLSDDIFMYSYRKNIDDEVNKEIFMREQAERDGLTDAYNKISTQNYISKEIENNPNAVFAFIMLDIDDFKMINDKHGHAFGDEVIIEFVNTIRNEFRQNDIIGRIGGDEFCVFTKSLDGEMLKKKVENLSRKLDKTVTKDGVTQTISASIGVWVNRANNQSFEDFYDGADKALYLTKDRGKNSYSIIDVTD